MLHTSDFGKTWDTLFKPYSIGAWIAGNNCVQYVCDASDSDHDFERPGLFRSLDRGINWQFIDSPRFTEIDDDDFRNISVPGGRRFSML
jgi:hypothetical protein